MKVLFVTAKQATDHLASCLWDGLQELLGEANLVDAVGHRCLHASMANESIYHGEENDSRFGSANVLTSISGRREGRILDGETGFDLLVLNAAFLRAGEFDWSWARQLTSRLKASAKVVYVEGWDSAREVHAPEMHVDAVFRKEIDPSYSYPYSCRHLTFAAPARWFNPADIAIQRPRDVFYSGTTHSNNPVRFSCLAAVFQTRRAHESVIASSHLGASVPDYFGHYRRSKIALCPSSAERADSLRTYEAVSCGAIPLFVDYPPWRREDWFDGLAFFCGGPGDVAAHIDAALDRDLPAMRRAIWEHAWHHHTTRVRAMKLLRTVGVL